MEQLDATDRRILTLLQEDATLSVKAISAAIGLTVSPTYDRINRLKKEGVIEKQIMLINREKVGLTVAAFCHINLKEHSLTLAQEFEDRITSFPEVMELDRLSGNFDYLLKVITADLKTYHEFIEQKLASLPNIGNLQSSFVMKEIKHETNLQLL